jgi:hypothetical protein
MSLVHDLFHPEGCNARRTALAVAGNGIKSFGRSGSEERPISCTQNRKHRHEHDLTQSDIPLTQNLVVVSPTTLTSGDQGSEG